MNDVNVITTDATHQGEEQQRTASTVVEDIFIAVICSW